MTARPALVARLSLIGPASPGVECLAGGWLVYPSRWSVAVRVAGQWVTSLTSSHAPGTTKFICLSDFHEL